jgi:hypothetical protein
MLSAVISVDSVLDVLAHRRVSCITDRPFYLIFTYDLIS